MKTIPDCCVVYTGWWWWMGGGELGHCYDTGYQQEPCQSGHDLTPAIYNIQWPYTSTSTSTRAGMVKSPSITSLGHDHNELHSVSRVK